VADDLHPPLSQLGPRALASASQRSSPASARAPQLSPRTLARTSQLSSTLPARGARPGTPAPARALTTSTLDVPKFTARGVVAGRSWWSLRLRPTWALASLALVAAGLVWLAWPRGEPEAALELPRARPPALPVPAPALPEPLAPVEPLELAEGASAELHTVSSIIRTQELSEERLRVRLSGGARFEVGPPRARGFVVESAQVLVRGLGSTAFSIDPEDTRTRVAVERGRVQIMWWSGATILHAGQSDVFPPLGESPFGRAYAERHKDAHEKRGKHEKHANKRKKSRDAQAKAAHAKVARTKAVHAKKGRHGKIAARLRGH
jgi:hypothetical protein